MHRPRERKSHVGIPASVRFAPWLEGRGFDVGAPYIPQVLDLIGTKAQALLQFRFNRLLFFEGMENHVSVRIHTSEFHFAQSELEIAFGILLWTEHFRQYFFSLLHE